MEKHWRVLNKNGYDLRQVLIDNREIKDAESFFKPHLFRLSSPASLFYDLEKAVERIKKAIKEKELIYIYGDFDVDGITGTAILWETIDLLGGKVLPYIPNREKEGYGIHKEALESVKKEGASLVISVDCGITALEEAKIAKKLSLDLIITDHHTRLETTPEAMAILHTDQLAGSGVAFMLAKALLETFSKEEDEQYFKNLELATIGTISDMVPLIGDNRIITTNGLHNLINSPRIGLKALYEEAAVAKKIGTYEVGFIIAPRLNAAGRLENALDALRLLLTRKKERARELAKKLSETNRQRQTEMQKAFDTAKSEVEKEGYSNMIVVHHPEYHQGVIGLVAGRLTDTFYRPAAAISEISPISKGSARSINGFNITQALASVKKHLVSHGGHPMAAGFSLESEQIPRFKEKVLNYADKQIKSKDLIPELKIDVKLDSKDIKLKTWEMIREFAPFGIGNPEPVFMSENLLVRDKKVLGNEGKHLRLRLTDENHRILNAVGFGLGAYPVNTGDKIDLAYTLNEDTWNGDRRLELKIKDIKKAKN